MAAAMERLEGRHVPGWTSSGGSRRGRNISAMAAPEAADAARSHLRVGRGGPRYAGLRNLDEAGHAIHRYVVAGAGLENHAAHHSSRPDRKRRQLTTSLAGQQFQFLKGPWTLLVHQTRERAVGQ